MNNQVEVIMQDIQARLTAMGEAAMTTEQVQKLVNEELQKVFADPDTPTKMRFGKSDNVDQKLFGTKYARWGLTISDIEYLYDMQVALNEYNPRKYKGPSETLRNAFGEISKAYYLPDEKIREIDKEAIDNMFPRIPLSAFYGPDRAKAARGEFSETDAYRRAMRAMDTAESGYGSQLVGASYVGELWEAARRESRIFQLLETFEMTSPTAYLPVEVDIPEMLYVPERATTPATAYDTVKTGSNQVEVAAKKFLIHQVWSGEMEEDSLIPFVPFLRRQGVLSVGHYADSLVINGDTTNAGTGNINLDDADPADTKHFLAFDGLRHAGLVDNTANSKDHAGAVIALANLVSARGRMVDATYLHDWGHPTQPGDLVHVADVELADQIGLIDEILNWRINAQQPLLNGQVGAVLNAPVIGSIAMSKTEADGKVSTTGTNNVLGQLLTFNKRGCVVGWRRRLKTEVERIPSTDQTRLVTSLRLGLGRFSPTGAAAGIEWADVLYNIGYS